METSSEIEPFKIKNVQGSNGFGIQVLAVIICKTETSFYFRAVQVYNLFWVQCFEAVEHWGLSVPVSGCQALWTHPTTQTFGVGSQTGERHSDMGILQKPKNYVKESNNVKKYSRDPKSGCVRILNGRHVRFFNGVRFLNGLG